MRPVLEPFKDIVGNCPALVELREKVEEFLRRQSRATRHPPVLIRGETGTGKDLLARLLHHASTRVSRPFVDVNCAAIPETLLEAELFGFERGAFTDARQAKEGLFQTANGGTLFLDEIALLPPALQSKLLNVLEAGAVRRLGATRNEPVNAWIIAATNEDLEAAVAAKRFREDLYHRLAVINFALPPLRERGNDVTVLAERFLERFCREYGLPAKSLSDGARAVLRAHHWPGNVRELSNIVERAVLLSESSTITADVLQLPVLAASRPGGEVRTDAQSADELARVRLVDALTKTSWNISRTAALLGLTRNTVRARIERYALKSPAGPGKGSVRREPGSTPVVSESRGLPSLPESAPPANQLSVRWDRRRIALLRVELGDREEPAGASLEWSNALKLIIEKVESFGGNVQDIGFDTVQASFWLEPIENPPRRAAHAALAIRRALLHADFAPNPSGRIAIHTDEVPVVYVGDTGRIDARSRREVEPLMDELAAAAAPGSIVASAAAAAFLRRQFVLAPAARSLPGHELYNVLGHHPFTVGEKSTRFVGRRQELALLKARMQSALGGRGQVATVIGDPGVGKSRLVWEFAHSADARPAKLLETGSTDAAITPYLPVIELLRRYFGIDPDDGRETVRERVGAATSGLDESVRTGLPALLALLGQADDDWQSLDPIERRHQTLEAVRRLLVAESRVEPLLVVFEDVHWIDSESQALLDALVTALPTSRFFLVLTYRPEYRHNWGHLSYYTQLNVGPLPSESATELLNALLGFHPSLDEVKQHLIGWTDGNPFFLEECVQTLIETQVLRGDPGGYRCTWPPAAPAVPSTVEDILATRIDRLAVEDKALVQSAAAIGTEVPLGVLAAVVDLSPDVLRDAMLRLQTAELLYESGAVGDGGFVFKHALTREVAYRTLLPQVRRELHQKIVAAMETIGDTAPESIDRLARHAFEGELWAKAAVYLTQAGDRAMGSAATREASEYFGQALDALARLPETERVLEDIVDLRLRMRDALWPQVRLPEILENLTQADLIAVRLKDRRRQGWIACYLCHYHWSAGDFGEGLRAGERALGIARDIGNVALIAETNFYLGNLQLALGDLVAAAQTFAASLRELDEAIATSSKEFPSPRFILIGRVVIRGFLSSALSQLGKFSQAIECVEPAMALAQATRSPFALVAAHGALGSVYVRKGDAAAGVSVLEPGLRLGRMYGLDHWIPSLSATLGAAYLQLGRVQEAIPLLEEAVEICERLGLRAHSSAWLTWLGEAYLIAGQREQASAVARRGLTLCRERKERGFEVSALWLMAEVAAVDAPGSDDVAMSLYKDALALAEACELRPFVARCQLGLAALHQRQGRSAEADALRGEATATMRTMDMHHPGVGV